MGSGDDGGPPINRARQRLEWIDAVTLDPNITHGAARLAHVLQSRFVNSKTGEAWPAQETLAKLLDTNERQVRIWITSLVRAGYLAVRRRGKGHSNAYTLIGRKPAAQTGDRTSNMTGNNSAGHPRIVDRQENRRLTGRKPAGESRRDSAENSDRGHKAPLSHVSLNSSELYDVDDASASHAPSINLSDVYAAIDYITVYGEGECGIIERRRNHLVVRSITGEVIRVARDGDRFVVQARSLS